MDGGILPVELLYSDSCDQLTYSDIQWSALQALAGGVIKHKGSNRAVVHRCFKICLVPAELDTFQSGYSQKHWLFRKTPTGRLYTSQSIARLAYNQLAHTCIKIRLVPAEPTELYSIKGRKQSFGCSSTFICYYRFQHLHLVIMMKEGFYVFFAELKSQMASWHNETEFVKQSKLHCLKFSIKANCWL